MSRINISGIISLINFFTDPKVAFKDKLIRIAVLFVIITVIITIIRALKNAGAKETFIGSNMWHGYGFQDANKTSKEERTKSLINISKGYLPGERPKSGGLLENFENVNNSYNPRNYEIEPDYHRTLQQFGVDPNPVESL